MFHLPVIIISFSVVRYDGFHVRSGLIRLRGVLGVCRGGSPAHAVLVDDLHAECRDERAPGQPDLAGFFVGAGRTWTIFAGP